MSGFDPDAYLAKKQAAAAFDPDAYLRTKAAPAEEPGVVEAALRGAGQGATLGFGDELAAGVGALIGNDNAPTLGQRYTNLRDSFRRDNAKAREAHPGVSMAGEMVGGLPLAIATGGQAKGLSLGGKIAAGAGTGALFGGLSAAGASEGDPNQAGADAGGGALLGGALGGALPLVGRTIALPLAQKLRDVGNNAGRRVLTRTSSALSAKKGVSDAAVEAAREAGAFGPLKDTKFANEVLDDARESMGDLYGTIVAELEAKGVKGPQAQALAAQLAQEAQSIRANTLGSPRPAVFQGVADELTGSPGGHMRAATPPKPTDATGNLGLTQAENMKRELQHIARHEYDKLKAMQTPAGEANEAVASRMRQAIEDAVDSQRALAPEAAAAFEPVKEKLGLLIQASNAARSGVNRSQKNAAISLPDIVAGSGPHGILGGVGMHVARTRGPSTVAWAAPGVADFLRALADPSTDKQLLAQMLRRAALPIAAEQAGGIQ